MMRTTLVLLSMAAISVPAAVAQAVPSQTVTPRYTLSLGYANVRANAPPSNCDCFGADGGYASASVALHNWFRVAGEVTGSHANNIGPLGQNLTLLTYTAGPEVNLHRGRFDVFGRGLFGAAHGSDSYFPSNGSVSSTATSFALSAGGGLDIGLTQHLAVRAVQAEYLRTQFPNGSQNVQNHLILGAGLVFHFGEAGWGRVARERNKAYKEMDRQERAAEKAPPPGMTPAPVATVQTPVSTSSTVVEDSSADFAQQVKNAYFDYDSYGLRPDAQQAVDHDADYLKAHPQLHVVIAGYADERGTAEYNLALGEKRAQAARDELIAKGVSPGQLEVISYGKEVQTCTADTDHCFQENRRVSLERR
jgi:peptidoglycan-associated lipoprotein